MTTLYASISDIVTGRTVRTTRPATGRRVFGTEAFARLASEELTTLERIGQGDQSAVRDCLDRFGNLVWSLARRLSGNQADAEDAVQEIFVDVWRSAERYDPTVASEATFIAMIARRRLIDRRRRLGRRPVEVSASAVADMHEDHRESSVDLLERSEDAAKARKAFGLLSTEQQRVLHLSLQYGRSHQQISEATGLPLGTVKTHARRGLLRIREALFGEPGASPTPDERREETQR